MSTKTGEIGIAIFFLFGRSVYVTSQGEQRTLKWPKTRSAQWQQVGLKTIQVVPAAFWVFYIRRLHLSHNSSSDCHENSDDNGQVEPYLYEPEDRGSEEISESSDDDSQSERLNNTEW